MKKVWAGHLAVRQCSYLGGEDFFGEDGGGISLGRPEEALLYSSVQPKSLTILPGAIQMNS